MATPTVSGELKPAYYETLRELERLTPQEPEDGDDSDEEKEPVIDWLTYNKHVQKYHDDSPKDAKPLTDREFSSMAAGRNAPVTLTNLIEGMVHVDGKPMSYGGPWKFQKAFTDVYGKHREGSKNIILASSRQCGKSTSQVVKSAALGMINPHYSTLYVTSRYKQVVVFSQQRFKRSLETSPEVMGSYVQPNRYLWQVACRQFSNGALFNFRSCFHDADGARGISANHLMIDEIQDIIPDVVGVLEQCQSQSPPDLKYRLYAGTAKTTASTVHRYWDHSCQFEWMTRCVGCGEYNLSDERIIKPTRYECTKCAAEIFPKQYGSWVPSKPELLDVRWGFRIPQTISPAREAKDLYADMTSPTMSRKEFYNEILGMPYDVGQVGLTETTLRQVCKSYGMFTISEIRDRYALKNIPVFAGVDYGTGEGTHPSFTVLCIGVGLPDGSFKVLYFKKFQGAEIDEYKQPGLISNICQGAGVRWLGADAGYGIDKNLRLENDYGWDRMSSGHGALLEFRYVEASKTASWVDRRYHINRTESMTELIQAVQGVRGKHNVQLFRFEDLIPFKSDLTAPTLEYNEKTLRSKYVHIYPDDAFHALNYAYMAFRQFNNDLVPTALPPTTWG